MSKVDVSGTIGSLLDFYKTEHRIYGRCPHCQQAFRLSEVKLTYGKEPPRDLLARMKNDRDKLQAELEALEQHIDELEDKHDRDVRTVNERWHTRFDVEVDKRMSKRVKEIRQAAIAHSRAGQLGKTLEKVAPMFPGFGHHPADVRPLFDPIDFVVFDGHYDQEVTDICFVEFKTGEGRLSAIQKRRVHFEEKRLSSSAVRALTEGKPAQVQQLIRTVVKQ